MVALVVQTWYKDADVVDLSIAPQIRQKGRRGIAVVAEWSSYTETRLSKFRPLRVPVNLGSNKDGTKIVTLCKKGFNSYIGTLLTACGKRHY